MRSSVIRFRIKYLLPLLLIAVAETQADPIEPGPEAPAISALEARDAADAARVAAEDAAIAADPL